MRSVQKGLRSGELDKDTYERLICNECGERLGTINQEGSVGVIRTCPECERRWEEF